MCQLLEVECNHKEKTVPNIAYIWGIGPDSRARSHIDSCYYQIKVHEQDKQHTARAMDKVFKEFLNKFKKYFLGEFLIYKDRETHLDKLPQCFLKMLWIWYKP